jgi:hypothetical protein
MKNAVNDRHQDARSQQTYTTAASHHQEPADQNAGATQNEKHTQNQKLENVRRPIRLVRIGNPTGPDEGTKCQPRDG